MGACFGRLFVIMSAMRFLEILDRSLREWHKDRATLLASSTAFYAVFSLAPLLIIMISFAGIFLDEAQVERALTGELASILGDQGGEALRTLVQAADASPHSVSAAAIGFVILFFGASGLMVALQNALNSIWKIEVHPDMNKIRAILLKRLFSFGMVLSLGFLLLVSLVASAAISFFFDLLVAQFSAAVVFVPLLNDILTFLVITLLFAILFKYLPDIHIAWKPVLVGALVTTALFSVGKYVLGIYFGQRDIASAYGVAGSIIILLLWVYYSAQILFFGAELTKAYASATKAQVKPRSYARFREEPYGWKWNTSGLVGKAGVVMGVLATEARIGWKIYKWRKKRGK